MEESKRTKKVKIKRRGHRNGKNRKRGKTN